MQKGTYWKYTFHIRLGPGHNRRFSSLSPDKLWKLKTLHLNAYCFFIARRFGFPFMGIQGLSGEKLEGASNMARPLSFSYGVHVIDNQSISSC